MYRIKKKSKSIAKNILFSAIISLVFLLFFEAVARLAYPVYSDYNTEMWRYATTLKKISNHPTLSHEHKPNSEAYLYCIHLKINSDGFRDYEYSVNKENDTFRILSMGDSIALGWGVELEDTYAKLIEKKLNQMKPSQKYSKYEVINAGVGNYNTAMELIRLKKDVLKYNPDLIIWEYYINDAEITSKKSMVNILKYSYLYAFLWGKYQNAKIKFFEGNDYKTFYSNLYKEGFEGKKVTRRSLYELISSLKEKEIPLLIVIFPEFHGFKNYEFSEVTEFVSEIACSQNVPVLDLLPYYIDYEPGLIWVSNEDAHPNALGNNIAADAIYETLIEQNLIPN